MTGGGGQQEARRRATSEVTFLVIDDDEVSVMAIERALRKLRIANPIRVARDGEEALCLLRGAGGVARVRRPLVVTLDLNMPRMDGLEFLAEVRRDPALRDLVIFVLSTSDTPDDIAAAYAGNVAGYVVKDDLGDSLHRALDMIGSFTRIVELPT